MERLSAPMERLSLHEAPAAPPPTPGGLPSSATARALDGGGGGGAAQTLTLCDLPDELLSLCITLAGRKCR